MSEETAQRSTTIGAAAGPRAPGLVGIGTLVAVVVAFRVGAFLAPSRFVAVPAPLALPIAALGLLFLACGVSTWRARPTDATRAFLLYGGAMGIHWGGAVGAASPTLETALFVFYAAVTTAGDGAFLDLALRFPRPEGGTPRAAAAVYLVALAALVAAPVSPWLPQRAVEVGLGLLFPALLLVSLAGAVIFVGKWLRATPELRRRTGLTPIVAALFVSVSANLAGDAGVLPGLPQAWGLPYALVPLALARALRRASS